MLDRINLYLFFLSILFSQFYVFQSGYPQPYNITLLLFCFLIVYKNKSSVLESGLVGLTPILFSFAIYVLIVNATASVTYKSLSFNFFSIQLTYNLLVFFSVFAFMQKQTGSVMAYVYAFFISALSLSIFWITGWGRYDFSAPIPGGGSVVRYNGFFNDPNQMAFWSLCGLAATALLTAARPRIKVIILVVSVSLIALSISRSALLGMIFTASGILISLLNFKNRAMFLTSKKFLIGISLLVITLLFLAWSSSMLDRFIMINFSAEAAARGFDRLLTHPQYLLFGAGQGLDQRFESIFEVHSTWIGFLFYYGIIGFSLFSWFVFSLMRQLDWPQRLIASGPFIYGLTTFGARSTMFWIFLASALHVANINLSRRNTTK